MEKSIKKYEDALKILIADSNGKRIAVRTLLSGKDTEGQPVNVAYTIALNELKNIN